MSTVLSLAPAPAPATAGSAEFYDFVRLGFGERRKTLWNNLAPAFSREALETLIAASGLPPGTRAEQLPASVFHDIFLALSADSMPKRPLRATPFFQEK
jgi:16S rRNA A1518/A1519 N6-dimethyltransferase RsmA/KsgA/DIM1 with predicted DNA glycosylase/AP lyase activity